MYIMVFQFEFIAIVWSSSILYACIIDGARGKKYGTIRYNTPYHSTPLLITTIHDYCCGNIVVHVILTRHLRKQERQRDSVPFCPCMKNTRKGSWIVSSCVRDLMG